MFMALESEISMTVQEERIAELETELDRLRAIVNENKIVEQATGAISVRYRMSPTEAFEMLHDGARAQRRRSRHIDALDVVNTEFFCMPPHDLFGRRVVDAIGLHGSVVGDDDVAVLPGDLRVVVDDDPLRSPIDLGHVLLTDTESALNQVLGHPPRVGGEVGATQYG